MKNSVDPDQLTKLADLVLQCFQEGCSILENAMFCLDEYYMYETHIT